MRELIALKDTYEVSSKQVKMWAQLVEAQGAKEMLDNIRNGKEFVW